ncbi:cysteine desulfurase [Candidatus Azambacteria bacterium]|nr:cysteine desulfurase [Candidatus Azambacteria bacterium]
MKRIYLDYAATTPVDKKVLAAIMPYFSERFGNPSSVHGYGQEALVALDRARHAVADMLGCLSQEVIFTGSATEANNLALGGVVHQALEKGKPVHIITSSIEHESVENPLMQLAQGPNVSVTHIPVSRDGFIDLDKFQKALTGHTVLVSVIYANNEIGTTQPISRIADIIRTHNKKFQVFPLRGISRRETSFKSKVLFHTDAAQAAYYLNMKTDELGVDLMTLSGHKMYAPKGVGVLYVKKGTPLTPLIVGSGQEYGKRSGTENIPGIVGMGEACAQIQENKEIVEKIKKLRDYFIAEVLGKINIASLNGAQENRLPGNANMLFKGVRAQDLIVMLDGEGVAVSAGSACQSKALAFSHVLSAIGLSEKDARSSIRFSFGKYTTKKDIDYTVAVLVKLIKTLYK